MTGFFQDVFTQNLVLCWQELYQTNIIGKKKIFTDTIDEYLASFNQMERGTRNFAKDEMKRNAAVVALKEKWSVNPDFLNGLSSKMFLKKPKSEFIYYPTPVQTKDELINLRERCQFLEAENAELKRRLSLETV